MRIAFVGEVIEWRGPAPFVYVRVPADAAAEIADVAASLSYGWGCLYAVVELGETTWRTALFPRDGGYLVPVKKAVQEAEGVGVGMDVALTLELGEPA